MPIKFPGPNAPCWCGSGQKFKKCHRNRQEQEPESPWIAVETIRKAFQFKKCSADGGALGACSGKIIHAHTVSRGANLAKIARNGKVVTYGGGYDVLEKSGGKLVPKEVGINQASTFNGFCAGHDARLFSCVENNEFSGRPDQCLAIAYRNLSRDLYAKDAAAAMQDALRGSDKGRSLQEQVAIQKQLTIANFGNDLARGELRASHDKVTRALAANNAGVLRTLIVECQDMLPFMTASAWSPINDLWGKEIQPAWNDAVLEQIFLSTFLGNDKSFVCLSWLEVDPAPGQIIADQITSLPATTQLNALLQFAVKHAENVFFSPAWFEALPVAERTFLDSLAADGLAEMGITPKVPLRVELNFNLPPSRAAYYAGTT